MPLGAGARLGPYEILSAIGAGGMGEVYRARDTRLKRDVALKTLPESFAADPDRLARFQREAEVLASLSHTNIAGIYGLEESDDIRALVMELVEGPHARGPHRTRTYPDRFLMITPVDDVVSPPITIVLNWDAALKK